MRKVLLLWAIVLVPIAGIFGTLLYGASRLGESFVETPETFETMQQVAISSRVEQPRFSPRVDINAPQSVIRWPAFKSPRVSAAPLELRIRKELWYPVEPVVDGGFVAPYAVRLKMEWPPIEDAPVIYMDSKSASPEGGAPMKTTGPEKIPALTLKRANIDSRDLLYDKGFRAESAYATDPRMPREDTVVIYCGRSPECTMYFDYLGRLATLEFPRRHFNDWDAGYRAALKLLRQVARPAKKKGES